jgi:putative IMPACT (imprinted ancient) family translation regulator
MQMLEYENITNVAIVVTRYFGGIKLGKGGLVRAYTGTAQMTLQAAGLCRMREDVILTFRTDYTHLGKLKNMSVNNGLFRIIDSEYSDKVIVTVAAELEYEEELVKIMADLTSGSGIVMSRTAEITKVRY